MSDESHRKDKRNFRSLRQEEISLLTYILSTQDNFAIIEPQILGGKVRDMDDGGMGSVEFLTNNNGRFGGVLANAEYTDSDGVLVSIAINIDDCGNLSEVDFWKVDFSPLKIFPKSQFVSIRNTKI